MSEPAITFDNVQVVAASDHEMQVRVQGKVIFIGNGEPLPGTTIRARGEHGRLVLPLWVVRELGLSIPAA